MSYFGDFCQATTTSAGTGNVTLAGVTNYFLPSAVGLLVGDQAVFSFKDPNGGKEVSLCTLVSTGPDVLSRDTCYSSSNSGSKISLSGGATTVLLVFCATDANKRFVAADAFLDYVVSGLLLPNSSGNLTGSLSSGIAYVIGQRVVKGAQANTYTASKDTYVDLSNVGVLTYTAVANAAAAPALTANSIRLGFVTTNGSAITGATTTGKDSLGNWMRNTVAVPTCKLYLVNTLGIGNNTESAMTFGAGSEILDNDGMHSTATNNSRLTIIHPGVYQINGALQWNALTDSFNVLFLQIYKNGAEQHELGSFDQWSISAQYPTQQAGGLVVASANDYFELYTLQVTGSSANTYAYGLSAIQVGLNGH